MSTTTTNTTTTTIATTTTTTTAAGSTLKNDTIFDVLSRLLNVSKLYEHQDADLLEPEKYSLTGIHIVIWTFCILTYVLAIPIAIRFIRTRAYLNPIDYFSLHIVLCAFFAWIPSLILILYYWFGIFTVKLCRLHYVILSTNETVCWIGFCSQRKIRFLFVGSILFRALYDYRSFSLRISIIQTEI